MKNLPAPLRGTRGPSSLAPETAQSFAASGRYVDDQVAQDRNLDELLVARPHRLISPKAIRPYQVD